MPYFCYLVIWLADQLVGWLVILNCKPLNSNSAFNNIFNFTGYLGAGFFPGDKAAGSWN